MLVRRGEGGENDHQQRCVRGRGGGGVRRGE